MSVLQNANFGGATVTFNGTSATVTPAVSGQALATFDYSGTLPQAGTITIAQDGSYTWGQLTVNTYICTSAANDGHYTCVAPSS